MDRIFLKKREEEVDQKAVKIWNNKQETDESQAKLTNFIIDNKKENGDKEMVEDDNDQIVQDESMPEENSNSDSIDDYLLNE